MEMTVMALLSNALNLISSSAKVLKLAVLVVLVIFSSINNVKAKIAVALTLNLTFECFNIIINYFTISKFCL